jgi:hypothetical protein
MKLSFAPKLVEKLVWFGFQLFRFCKLSFPVMHLMPYYAETGCSRPLTIRTTFFISSTKWKPVHTDWQLVSWMKTRSLWNEKQKKKSNKLSVKSWVLTHYIMYISHAFNATIPIGDNKYVLVDSLGSCSVDQTELQCRRRTM